MTWGAEYAAGRLNDSIGEFDEMLKSSHPDELNERLRRWKSRTEGVIRDVINEDEARSFAKLSLSYDSAYPRSFTAMLDRLRSFLVVLSEEVQRDPGMIRISGEQLMSVEGWTNLQDKVLRAIAVAETRGRRLAAKDVEQAVGANTIQTEIILQALRDERLITGIDASTFDGFDLLEIRLLPEGRKAISQMKASSALTSATPVSSLRLFISHSSADAKVASALIELIEHSLGLKPLEIRCTSVTGYRLQAGANTLEQLRQEVFEADAFLALLSKDSLKSTFVLFELGARWGANRHLAPVLACGLEPGDLRGPLTNLNALSLSDDGQVYQLLSDLGSVLSLSPLPPPSYAARVSKLVDLNRDLTA